MRLGLTWEVALQHRREIRHRIGARGDGVELGGLGEPRASWRPARHDRDVEIERTEALAEEPRPVAQRALDLAPQAQAIVAEALAQLLLRRLARDPAAR